MLAWRYFALLDLIDGPITSYRTLYSCRYGIEVIYGRGWDANSSFYRFWACRFL